MKQKAVVLLSGGLDSTTLLYYVLKNNYIPYNLIFDYGQKHKKEILRARKISDINKCEYKVIKFKLPWEAGSLVDRNKQIKYRNLSEILKKGIPETYVPARNTIFLAFALSFAESISAERIFIGANSIDFSGYPDCRPVFITAFNRLILSASKKKNIKIVAPFIKMSKKQIIQLGIKYGVPYELTWSCYRGSMTPCMRCDSCLLRAKGFKEAGINDPLLNKKI